MLNTRTLYIIWVCFLLFCLCLPVHFKTDYFKKYILTIKCPTSSVHSIKPGVAAVSVYDVHADDAVDIVVAL